MKTVGEIYKLRNLIKEPTCFQNPDNPTCTDLIMTNKSLSFKSTYVIETELSDFYKMVVAVMKMHFPKMKPQVVSYRKYKEFHNETFLDSIRHELTRGGSRAAATSKMERFVIIVNGFQQLTIITKRSILDVATALDPPPLNVQGQFLT